MQPIPALAAFDYVAPGVLHCSPLLPGSGAILASTRTVLGAHQQTLKNRGNLPYSKMTHVLCPYELGNTFASVSESLNRIFQNFWSKFESRLQAFG
ncbi:Hypothetical predicted protein, partial [Pelobates cultripes]